MSNPISSSRDDLEQAYRTPDPMLAGHQRAEAVVAGAEGITVLASANHAGDTEHTWLLRLGLDGTTTWEQHYDPKYGTGRALVRLAGGGLAIAGDVRRGPTEYQAALVRVSPAGEVVGSLALGPRGVTGFYALGARPDDSIVAGGTAGWKGWLVTSDGALNRPGERALDVDEVNAMAVLASGDVAALASVEKSTSGFGRAQVTALGPDGAVRWQRQLPSSGRGDPKSLVAGHDGVLAVGTGAVDDRAPSHVWLARLDAAGEIAWEHTLGNDQASWRARAATALADGFAVAGETATPDGGRAPHVWRLGPDGAVRWDHGYSGANGGPAGEMVTGLAATGDGGLVVVGSIARGPGRTNVWVVRLDADGKVVWQRTFGAPAADARSLPS
jgi:hypothetical protein